ncbi:MAG TPA: ABC transporter ATP-binding protein [Desulfosporosinus sp.]|nr:ABC transporter ATP-binding protein [Desulfosporosinus sp.]
MSTIEILNVSKSFSKTVALKNVSVTLEPNKIYGLLGRNGSGKTTLLNIITNKLFASSGDVLIDGETAVENDHAQVKIFCMGEKNIYPVAMKVKDAIKWTKAFYPNFNLKYAEELAVKFKLDTHKKIKDLSTGYSSILKLILGLASGVAVILFDEPVLGLDANNRELFYRELIANYSEQPKTIVISTHLIEEISSILEEIIILKEGEIVLAQPVEKVLQWGYTVSGDCTNVDKYAKGKNIIREETIGSFKTTTLYQTRDSNDQAVIKEFGLEICPVKLQELIIDLTNS